MPVASRSFLLFSFRYVKPRGVTSQLEEEDILAPFKEIGRLGTVIEIPTEKSVSSIQITGDVKQNTDAKVGKPSSKIAIKKETKQTANKKPFEYSTKAQQSFQAISFETTTASRNKKLKNNEKYMAALHPSGAINTSKQFKYSQSSVAYDNKVRQPISGTFWRRILNNFSTSPVSFFQLENFHSAESAYYYDAQDYPSLYEEDSSLRRNAFSVHGFERPQTRFPKPVGCFLPSWCLWIGWIAVAVHLILTSAFTIIYGLQVN